MRTVTLEWRVRCRWLLPALFVVLTACLVVQRRHAGYSMGVLRHSAVFDGIKVLGDAKFVAAVTEALGRLKSNVPTEYALIRPHVGRIEQNRRSGVNPRNDPPTVYLSERTVYTSPTWCAGSMMHDGYHSRLYREHLRQHGGSVPDSVWRGQAAELRCIEFQARVSRNLQAPQYELDYLATLDGTHFDVDDDGKETWYDFWMRDW